MLPNKNGFTLIELLVVVAIIGILAAVGVVAYNGYTSAAKASQTKSIHSQYIKFVKAEVMRCEVGADNIFPAQSNPSGNLHSHPRNASHVCR